MTRSTATTDHRVQFDFEIEFSNGGGLQGQGFRLDIEGADIDDRALADYIVRDLDLLLAGEVRILRKRIIREPHKRRPPQRIDLSHDVEDGMVTYRGLPAAVICEPALLAFHRFADGADLSELPLERLAHLDGVVVDLEDLGALGDVSGKAVLVRTGWDRHWRTDAYFEGHPFLTQDDARRLADGGAALVGIDSLNIDDTDDGARPVHTILLGAGIPVCEHMTNLAALPDRGFRFSAVPIKVKGMGTFPVRAYAISAAG